MTMTSVATSIILTPLGEATPSEQALLAEEYQQAFPIEEQRPWGEICATIGELQAWVVRRLKGEPIGLVTLWRLEDFGYIEHLFTLPTARNGGIGGVIILKIIQELSPALLILEAELADSSDLARRRLGFYARHGLAVQPYPYEQPPYTLGGEWVPLHLLSTRPLTAEHFEQVRRSLYEVVYRVCP